MVPASSFDTSIFALPPDDDSDEEPNEEADGTDDSVDRALASSGEEERLKKGSGLEWTMRTTGGGSRAGVADSIVQQGSLGTDDGSIGFGSALSERKPWDSVESTASPPPPPPREEQPVVAASLSQLPSYLQSPESKTPTSDAAESFSRDVSAPAPSPAPALAPSPAPTPAAVTASAPATALASGLAPAPPAAEDSPPPSPPASPAASMEIEAVTHQSPALGDTGQRLQQLIRDAEGNAMLWADVRQGAGEVLDQGTGSRPPVTTAPLAPPLASIESEGASSRTTTEGSTNFQVDLPPGVQDSMSHLHIRAAAAVASDCLSSSYGGEGSVHEHYAEGVNEYEDEDDYEEEDEDYDEVADEGMMRNPNSRDIDWASAVAGEARNQAARASHGSQASASNQRPTPSVETPQQPPVVEDTRPAAAPDLWASGVMPASPTWKDPAALPDPGPDPQPAVPPSALVPLLYRRARQALKRQSKPRSSDADKVDEGATPLCDVDLWVVAGLDPDDVDANALQETRRLYLAESALAANSSAHGSSVSASFSAGSSRPALERVAVEVLGQGPLRRWYDALRREGLVRDRLLRQYQEECNRLAKTAAQDRAAAKAANDAATAAKSQVSGPRVSQDAAALPKTDQTAAQVHARLRGELDAESAAAAATEALHGAEQRLRELASENEGLKREKRALELRCEGLDERTLATENSVLRRCQAELARERDAHAEVVDGLEAKLAWYVENQALADAAVEDLARERAHSRAIEERLKNMSMNREDGPGSEAKDRKIKALEAQLRRHTDGKGRPKDPLATLIEAARPPKDEALAAATARCEALEAEMEEVRRDASLAMRSLKQQFDQLQLRYKDAANALKRQNTSTADSAKGSHSLGGSGGGGVGLTNGAAANVSNGRAVVVRLAEAEAKVDQLTRALAKKGAYLEAKLRAEKERSAKQLANLKAQLGARRRRLRGSMADSLDGGVESEGEDEDEPMVKRRERERLAAALQASESERRRLEHDLEYAVGALEEFKFRAAQQEPEQRQEQETRETRQEQPLPPLPPPNQVDSSPPSATGVHEPSSAATVAATVATAVAAAREEERAAGLAAQKSLEAVVLALQGGGSSDGANAVKMKGLLDENDALQQEARRLKARLDALQADSAAAAHRAAAQIAEAVARADAAEAAARAQAAVSAAAEAPTAALAAKCDKLGKRLEEVEARATARETALGESLRRAREAGSGELARLRALHESELAEKDVKLERLRRELDALLDALQTAISQRGPPRAPAVSVPFVPHPPPSPRSPGRGGRIAQSSKTRVEDNAQCSPIRH